MSGKVLAWLTALLLVAGLAAQTVRLEARLRANKALHAVEVVTSTLLARGRLRPDVLWAHVQLLERAAEDDPADVGIPLALGSQYVLLHRPKEAIAAYRRALDLEPRPEIYLNLGRAQLLAGDRAAAEKSYAAARALDPWLVRRQGGVPEAARTP